MSFTTLLLASYHLPAVYIFTSLSAALTLRQSYATRKGDRVVHALLRRRCPFQCDLLGRRIRAESFFGEGALRNWTAVRARCRRCGGKLTSGGEGRLSSRSYRFQKLSVNGLVILVIERVQSLHLKEKETLAVKDIARIHTLTILHCSFLAYQLEDIVFCTLSRHIGNTFCHSFVVSTATNARASPFKQASLRGQSPTQNCTGCSTCVGDRRSHAHTRSS